MNPSSESPTSLESWLARSYERFLHSFQAHACKSSPGMKGPGTHGSWITLSPFLPIELDACFLESVLDKHAIDLAGALYRVLEIVIDVPARKLLAANVICQEQGKPISVTGVDDGSMQARVANALGQHASVVAMPDAALDAMFAAAKDARARNGAPLPPVDTIRIIDARLHEQLMGLGMPGASADVAAGVADAADAVVDASLDSIARGAATLLAGCRDGLVRYHPVTDKLATFLCKAGNALRGPVIEDIAAMATTFFPAGSAVIVLHSGDAMTAFRASRSKRGDVSITSLHPSGLDDMLPIKPDTIITISKKLRRDTRANVVLFFSIEGIVEMLAMIVDGIAAGEHKRNGPALLQAFIESACFYARTFEQTWYSRPRTMVTKLFPRFMARFAGVRIDLPRILHDKLASVAPVQGSRFVLVAGTKLADAIASTWKVLFRRVAWNPFALLDVIKRCKDPRSLGLYPMPQAIGDFLGQQHKAMARQLSRALILKY
ncbi:MAG: hypothetical protein GYA24_20950 [Candidatus Lokiarchaeota archaeon]|nr:hypothetical protein [Candidatus Lokiarchaeota archaeon]